MKKFFCTCLGVILFLTNIPCIYAENNLGIVSKSAILLDSKGNIILEENAHEKREPASVTKIMTMLLTLEAIKSGKISLEDQVIVSKNAEGQGGTQVYLKEGEVISVDELLKCVAISSANDGAMALAEYISGSKEAFVELMNKRAYELEMTNTTFKNPTGLTAQGHETTAYDIALMSVELLKHEEIYQYTTIWLDSIRDGEFELANTNKLLKQYDGMIGLKTGFTTNAMYCISAVATRENETFIAICMGAETSELRNADATKMLNYAFANYKTIKPDIPEVFYDIKVFGGEKDVLSARAEKQEIEILVNKNDEVTFEIEIEESLQAPIEQNAKIGKINILLQDKQVQSIDIISNDNVEIITFKWIVVKFAQNFFMKKTQI